MRKRLFNLSQHLHFQYYKCILFKAYLSFLRPLPCLLAWTCNAHPSFGEPPVKYFGSLLLHKRLDICMTLEKHKIAKPQKILLWYCSWSWFNKNASQMYMQPTTQLESLLQICRTLFCKIVDIITSLPGLKSLTLTSASSQLPSWASNHYISIYPVLDAVVKMSRDIYCQLQGK